MDTPAVNLNDIPLFVEVARRKSYTLAARALELPVSTLSRRIGDLERAIGLPLINRSTRRLGLTEAGLAYYERCRKLVGAANVAHEDLGDSAPPPTGVLRVAITHSLAVLLLPHTLEAFMRAYPGIHCEFDLALRRPDPASGCFDVMLRLVSSGDPVGMSVRELASVPTLLYASADYLNQHGVPRQPHDLQPLDCIRTTSSDSDSFWDLYGPDNRHVRVPVHGRLSVNNVSVAAVLASKRQGVVRLPQFPGMADHTRRLGLVQVLPAWRLAPLPVFAVFPSSVLPARTRAFMTYIEGMLTDRPAD